MCHKFKYSFKKSFYHTKKFLAIDENFNHWFVKILWKIYHVLEKICRNYSLYLVQIYNFCTMMLAMQALFRYVLEKVREQNRITHVHLIVCV